MKIISVQVCEGLWFRILVLRVKQIGRIVSPYFPGHAIILVQSYLWFTFVDQSSFILMRYIYL